MDRKPFMDRGKDETIGSDQRTGENHEGRTAVLIVVLFSTSVFSLRTTSQRRQILLAKAVRRLKPPPNHGFQEITDGRRCQQFDISVATGFLLAAIGNAQLVHAAVEGRGINP